MKKVSTLLILLLVAQLAVAQGKFTKKLNSSDADIANPKRKDLVKTWVTRGNLFAEIAEDPVSGLVAGLSKTMLTSTLKGQKPTEVKEWKSSEGTAYELQVYPDKDLYFDANGMLAFWTIKSTEVENPLEKAFEAFKHVQQIDQNNADAKNGFIDLAKMYSSKAMDGYMRNDMQVTLDGFKGSYEANATAGIIDTLAMYNVAFIANSMKDYPLAEEFYKKCIDNGYIAEGSVYASLADVYVKAGKKADAEKLLSEVYTKYPENQNILISLINFYMDSGDDPRKVIEFIKLAQANEPTNASLNYAEGMLYEKLGDKDNATAAYKNAITKDPKNFYAQYALGAMYYNNAAELGKKADELPLNAQKEYDEYIVQINDFLKKSIEPFEAAYAIEPNAAIVESLKNVYYRFVDESPEMKAKYEKYETLLKQIDSEEVAAEE